MSDRDLAHNPDAAAAAIAMRVLELEADALHSLARQVPQAFGPAVAAILAARGRVIVSGVGKSGHVGRKIAATLASTGTPALFVHPTEASHGDLGMIGRDDVVLALSKSGETRELADLIAYSRRFGIPLCGVTAKPDSALARACDFLLAVPDAPEACAETRAPTTSTTLMIALGDALAVALLEARGFTAQDFHNFHPGGSLGAMLKTVADLMHVGAEVPLVPLGTSVIEAISVISAKGFGCVGVVDQQGALAGVITDGDLRRRTGQDLASKQVDDIMTRPARTIAPDQLASLALKIINETRITQLFVIEGAVPVGIIHVHDFLKAGVL